MPQSPAQVPEHLADIGAVADRRDSDIDFGTAGASGRREYERRRANREAKTRDQHPHIGGLLLKLKEQPQHEKAWATGAAGEEALAAFLARHCPDVLVLNDRCMPRSPANVDHLAVAPSGVYVIDAKRYKGKIEVRKPLFGAEKLVIAGRDKTKLVEGLSKQVEAVRTGLASIEKQVPVRAGLCFINPDGQSGGNGIPLFRTLTVSGVPLLYRRKLAKRLNQLGALERDEALVVAEALSTLFPAAQRGILSPGPAMQLDTTVGGSLELTDGLRIMSRARTALTSQIWRVRAGSV